MRIADAGQKLPIHERRPGKVVLFDAARNLWRQGRAACRPIPSRLWWRWGMLLLIGFVLCNLFTILLTRFARAQAWLTAWDQRWLRFIELHGPSFPDAILMESPGNLSYLIPLTLTASIIALHWRRPMVAFSIQAAYWGVRPMIFAGWGTWNRARPDLIAEGIAAPGLHSFPSGHAALSTAVYGFLVYLWLRRSRSVPEKLIGTAILIAIVTMVSIARVRLGTHWPSDIIAGAMIGALWLGVVITAFRSSTTESL